MARTVKAPPASTKKLHIGRCLARCRSCGTGPCRCTGYRFSRDVGGYSECVCGHTSHIHAAVEVPA